MKTWNERLAAALAESEMIPADLARACKVSTASVSDWLTGVTKTLKATSAEKICAALNINHRWLLSGKGHMRPGLRATPGVGDTNAGLYVPNLSPRLAELLQDLDMEDLERLEEQAELYLLRRASKQ